MTVGGLDIGTTGCKLTLYETDGSYIDSAYKEYDATHKNGEHELDTELVFRSVCEVIRACASKHKDIKGIAIASLGESFALLDEEDRVLFPALLYTDPRGAEECRELCHLVGEERLREIVGVKPHSMYSLPKLLWIRKNRPEIFARARRVLFIGDFVGYMLTGVAQVDYSLASRSMAFDIKEKCFSHEILDKVGISTELFSTPVPSGTPLGRVKADVAEKTGLSPDTVIVTGCQDQIAAAIGAGVLKAGEAIDGAGTVECITPVFDGIPTGEGFYDGGFPVVPFATEGKYVSYALAFTGGAVLKWYRDNFAKYRKCESIYATLDSEIGDEPTGLLVMPHFAGAATPHMDSSAKAAIVGLTLETTDADIYKALMEGVAYEMRQSLEHLAAHGVRPKVLYATGGGAKSEKWLSIKADILGLPITPIDAKEVGASGLCMLVAVALGVFRDTDEAKEVFVKTGKTYYPDEKRRAAYNEYYRAYRMMFDAIKPMTDILNTVK